MATSAAIASLGAAAKELKDQVDAVRTELDTAVRAVAVGDARLAGTGLMLVFTGYCFQLGALLVR